MSTKTVLITGVSRGIGRACTLCFGEAGYHIIGCAKNDSEAFASLKQELSERKIPNLLLYGDIADSSFVDTLFTEGIRQFSRLDVLINNAGISRSGLVSDLSDETLSEVLSVNLTAAIKCCRKAIPFFLKNRDYSIKKDPAEPIGRILNISSVFGCRGASFEVAYSASKAGINALTEGLARELALNDITVNALACGFVDTDMNRHLSEEERSAILQEIPMNRFTSPDEVAKALLLLTEMPGYLTGQIIRFDGGWF